jgi:hypothetical protein
MKQGRNAFVNACQLAPIALTSGARAALLSDASKMRVNLADGLPILFMNKGRFHGLTAIS